MYWEDDEGILPSDVRFEHLENGTCRGTAPLITGEFWEAFLDRHATKVAITFVFDVCYGGRAYRYEECARSVEFGKYRFVSTGNTRGDGEWRNTITSAKGSRFAYLSASSQNEPAMEKLVDGEITGAFTCTMEHVLTKVQVLFFLVIVMRKFNTHKSEPVVL